MYGYSISFSCSRWNKFSDYAGHSSYLVFVCGQSEKLEIADVVLERESENR